jgi:hypothetical protein
MAKNSIRDFDNTAGNNTDIQSVDIAENCAPSGINNAIRELMADMADVNDGTVALVSPAMDSADINGGTIDGVTIGGASAGAGTFTTLTAGSGTHTIGDGTAASQVIIKASSTTNATIDFGDSDDTNIGRIQYNNTDNSMLFRTNNAERMRIDSSGNVGIGIATPSTDLHLFKTTGDVGITVQSSATANAKAFVDLYGRDASNVNQIWKIENDAHSLKIKDDGSTKMTLDASGNVLVGETSTPADVAGLYVKNTDPDDNFAGQLGLKGTATSGAADTGAAIAFEGHNGSGNRSLGQIAVLKENSTVGNNDSYMRFVTRDNSLGSTERMRIDSSGNVGIGESDPQYQVQLSKGNAGGVGPVLYLKNDVDSASTGHAAEIRFNLRAAEATSRNALIKAEAEIGYGASPALTFHTSSGNTGEPQERMRIRSGGSILMSRDDAALATTGHYFDSSGYVYHTRDAGQVMYLNREGTSDGEILGFYKDGSTVGSIFSISANSIAIGQGNTNLRMHDGSLSVRPVFSTGTNRDNAIDLGTSSARFDDIYATNGTIQTSDRNEKQQIASLTDAEITAAKAISKLFKTFKWNDSVEEKGDAARTHAGVIAQDVQQAMSNAGLDAGDYAFFISTTWWEAEIEVPAVEAVEAVDAVYEDVVIEAVLDDDGNEIEPERTEQRLVSEAVEAVEAQDAYTRTDTYDTAEEAPEGATERTRMGIRYPELLAFIGAATEQRLADIETRLTALETL